MFEFFPPGPDSDKVVPIGLDVEKLLGETPMSLAAERLLTPAGLRGVLQGTVFFFRKKQSWMLRTPDEQTARQVARRAHKNLVGKRSLTASDPFLHHLTLYVAYPGGYVKVDGPPEKARDSEKLDAKYRITQKGKETFGARGVSLSGSEGKYMLVLTPTVKSLRGSKRVQLLAPTLEELEQKLDDVIEDINHNKRSDSMNRIASPRDLQAELRSVVAFIHASEKPDRQIVASKLRDLADRVARAPDKDVFRLMDKFKEDHPGHVTGKVYPSSKMPEFMKWLKMQTSDKGLAEDVFGLLFKGLDYDDFDALWAGQKIASFDEVLAEDGFVMQASGSVAEATFKKLRDGSWGLLVNSQRVSPGDKVLTITKAGKRSYKFVGKIVWAGNGVTICTINEEGEDGPQQQQPSPSGKASPRQVDYTMNLINRLVRNQGWFDSDMGQFGDPPSRREVENMTVKEVSELIESLRSEQ